MLAGLAVKVQKRRRRHQHLWNSLHVQEMRFIVGRSCVAFRVVRQQR